MGLIIRTTGLEQYAPGGEAVLKTLLIGGPGSGKTRLSSYWPKPLYADCEGGLSSIADRQMPFVTIKNSQDMLDVLTHLKTDRRPYRDKDYQTIVIDTLDAFQRKVKDEWLQANPGNQSFRGFDAWGYLDTKMQMLLTRLLNLDINVMICVHYKDKVIREGTGENATERQELMLQLSGDIKDSVFNDFDLVGWLGKYYEAVDGQRVEKRGLTFKSTPDKPFLKDRLHVTPPWMPVTFSDQDYATLFAAFTARLDGLDEGEDVGEIPSAGPGAVSPLAMTSGALPAMSPSEVPLTQYDKPTLVKMARDLGLTFKGNTIKHELVEMIEAKRVEDAKAAEEAKASYGTPALAAEAAATAGVEQAPPSSIDSGVPAVLEDVPAEPGPSTTVAGVAEPVSVSDVPVIPAQRTTPDDASPGDAPAAEVTPDAIPTTVAQIPVPTVAADGVVVDPSTGEVLEKAVANAVVGLGATVLSPPEGVDRAAVTPAPPPAQSLGVAQDQVACEWDGCGKDLAGENADYVKLSWIKYRKKYCNAHFMEKKRAGA